MPNIETADLGLIDRVQIRNSRTKKDSYPICKKNLIHPDKITTTNFVLWSGSATLVQDAEMVPEVVARHLPERGVLRVLRSILPLGNLPETGLVYFRLDRIFKTFFLLYDYEVLGHFM